MTPESTSGLGPVLRAVGVRIAGAVATLVGASALALGLLVLAPGDPIDLVPNGEELRPVLEAQWGLDRPLPERFARSLGRVVTLDFGTSLTYRPGAPVAEVIEGPALRTAGLVGAALLLGVTWGAGLAALTAGRRSALRPLVIGLSVTPVFLLAHAAVAGLNAGAWWAIGAQWIDRPAWFALPDQPSALRTSLAVVLLAVGSGALSEVHGEVEDALVRLRSSPHLDAARARGAAAWPHLAIGLVAPLASTAASRAALLIGGAVIVEKVLLLNGAGAVLWSAAELRDYDLALALSILAAAAVAGARLVADLVRVSVDPRLRSAP